MHFVSQLPKNIKAKERKAQHARKRMLPHLGSRILDDEDPPEFSGGGLSSEDEVLHSNMVIPFCSLDRLAFAAKCGGLSVSRIMIKTIYVL